MFSDGTSQNESSNGGEYHNQMRLAACLFFTWSYNKDVFPEWLRSNVSSETGKRPWMSWPLSCFLSGESC
jgi:hypothetical protein